MEQIQKLCVDAAFRESLLKVCHSFKVPITEMSVSIRVYDKGKLQFTMHRKDVPQQAFDIRMMMNTKMAAMRFDTDSLKYMLRCVHYAFLHDGGSLHPERISLLLYESKKAKCTCIGIMENNNPVKAMRLIDIFESMNLGNELLN